MKTNITYTAEEYARTKTESSFRTKVEMHTLFSLIGSPVNKLILDAGCGEGVYSRKLVDLGAEKVIGVDCAQDFIDMALSKNSGYEHKISYHNAFVQDFFGNGDMDIVVGSYVMSYPQNLDEAIAYCSAMASHLKSGGLFVGFNNNPFEEFIGERYEKYGFKKIMNSIDEGAQTIYLVNGMSNPIINYHLKPATYEDAFTKAGFDMFEWSRADLSGDEVSNPYWDEFFKDEPPFIGMIARKK
jgi:SAM-dependent methyltransferase